MPESLNPVPDTTKLAHAGFVQQPPSDGTARSVTALAPAQRGGSSRSALLAALAGRRRRARDARARSRTGHGRRNHFPTWLSQASPSTRSPSIASGPRPLSPYGPGAGIRTELLDGYDHQGSEEALARLPRSPPKTSADRDLLSGFGERPVQDRAALAGDVPEPRFAVGAADG